MNKDFDGWNTLKKKINEETTKVSNLYWKEREIWFCSLGINIGVEQDGKNDFYERPILIIKKVSQNAFLGIPLTSKRKTGNWYVPLDYVNSSVMINQVKLLDCSRLNRRIKIVSPEEFNYIKACLKAYI